MVFFDISNTIIFSILGTCMQEFTNHSQFSSINVAFVGAGPGDPELFTIKGMDRVRNAEFILHDALGCEEIIDRYAMPHTELHAVGKRKGLHCPQEYINNLLVEKARTGCRVVRLKGGDPFLFGRASEEIEALRAAGIPWEIIPGISSALAVPALAGIPVTSRGVSASFGIASAHQCKSQDLHTDIIRQVALGTQTLVVLMCKTRLNWVARQCINAGLAPHTPVAFILDGSLPNQRQWRGILLDLENWQLPQDASGPGLLVVGNTIQLPS